MCRFFTKKNLFKGMAAGNIIFPLVLSIYFYHQENSELGTACLAWLFGAIGSVRAGYVIGLMQPCPIPHLAENLQVEMQEQREAEVEGEYKQPELQEFKQNRM